MSGKKPTGKKLVRSRPKSSLAPVTNLAADVRSLIDRARTATAQIVNSALVLLYWSIGERIRKDILKEKRAEYGEEIVSTLSRQLAAEYGNGYSRQNLFRMLRLADVFPQQEIVVALSRQLGWSHFVEIIPIKDQLKRDFYAEMCRIERWSVRTLRDKINGLLFERTVTAEPGGAVRGRGGFCAVRGGVTMGFLPFEGGRSSGMPVN
jgi:hypothetical protein